MSIESSEDAPDLVETPPPAPPPPAADRYRAALAKNHGAQLVAILQALEAYDRSIRPAELVGAVYERLDDARFVEGLIGRLGDGPRLTMGLFAITESPVWAAAGLVHTLAALGIESGPVVAELIGLGLLAAGVEGESGPHVLIAHPTAVSAARTILPDGEIPPPAGPVRQVRQSDGLEPILRLAALWQRVDQAALRRTQQGTLYKRDRERIEDDPVLVGPITDALEPLPDMAGLWLALARGVGLVIDEPDSDRTVAAPAEFWAENAVHLPQMIAQRWLGLRTWHEQGGIQPEDAPAQLATPYLRPALLLWLARYGPEEWIATDDLAAILDRNHPGWSGSLLAEAEPSNSPENAVRGRIGAEARTRPASRRKKAEDEPEPLGGGALLEAILLGPAYQLGLIRAAEEDPSGRRIVQLTDLGRYALAIGPPPPPRSTFEHFLFVQPNFEVIAYRQGLNSALIGQLSRFMTWTQSGAALEMKLTPESVYHALEGGLTPEAMIARLSRHSARPLPPGVHEAVKTWASRRDRVTYFGSATLIEFASAEALEQALEVWSVEGKPAPTRISERVLLVEDEATIPFNKFKLAGSRDYRRPPETCVEVAPDGVTLSLDLSRSDLFIDAELARMAEELPSDGPAVALKRKYRVTPSSLSRAVEDGLNAATLSRWFAQRVGAEVPPAMRMLLHASSPKPEPPRVSRPIVLTSPTSDLLDGLLQHPATRDYLGTRLGPTTAVVPDALLEPLRKALSGFGLNLDGL